jgi:hypothetical protein
MFEAIKNALQGRLGGRKKAHMPDPTPPAPIDTNALATAIAGALGPVLKTAIAEANQPVAGRPGQAAGPDADTHADADADAAPTAEGGKPKFLTAADQAPAS